MAKEILRREVPFISGHLDFLSMNDRPFFLTENTSDAVVLDALEGWSYHEGRQKKDRSRKIRAEENLEAENTKRR